jgi:hypothetical protein
MKKIVLFASALLMSFQAQAAIVSVSGDGEHVLAGFTVHEDTPTNTLQQGFNEKQSHILTKDITHDGGVISKGTRVDSHLIFLNTKGKKPAVDTTAKWTFSGDVIGVMSDYIGQFLKDSNSELSNFNNFTIGKSLTFNAAGLEGNFDGYVITGNMLDLKMRVTEPGDWIRVITVSEVPVPAALWLFAPALMGFLGLRRKSKLEA